MSLSVRQFVLIVCYIFFFGLFSRCKVADVPQLPASPPVLATFVGEADTLSMGDLIWENFFNDPFLLTLIDSALQNNLDLRAAAQRIKVAQADYRLRRGALLPAVRGNVAANLGTVVNPNLVNDPNVDQSANNIAQNYFVGFQSSWEADLWGRLRLRREAAYLRFLASEKGQHLLITNLVADVARLYYELLGLDNELSTIEQNVEFQKIALELVRIQKIAGRATELAVQQFQAQLLRTKSLGYEKRQRIIEVENELNALLGRYPQPIARGTSILEQSLPDVVRTGVPSSLLLRRPDIREAELALAAAQADVAAARKAFFPSLVLSPFVGMNAPELSMLVEPEAFAVGLLAGLTAPIFQQNQLRAGFDRATAETLEAYYSYRQVVITGHQEVVTNLRRAENYRAAYELRQEEAEVLKAAVETSNALFTAGYANYLEIITAQARVLEAELSVVDTRKEIFVSLINLYRALGGGWK